MKAKIIILILFFSFVINNELLCSRSLIYSGGSPGIFFEYSISNNQKSFSLGLNEIKFPEKVKSNKFVYQLNVINYDFVISDKYNNDNFSNSYYLSAINLLWLFSSTGLPFLFDKENMFFTKDDVSIMWNLPVYLTNSQTEYPLFYILTGYETYNRTSLFFKSKLDYFSNTNSWWQYKPAIGISFNEVLGDRYKSNTGIKISLGLEKPFILINGKIIQNEFKPFIGINIYWENNDVKNPEDPIMD
jgi:hypothetical protein